MLGGINRWDHTKWLIHFVRERNAEQSPSKFGLFDPVANDIEPNADAFSVLSTIIRLGGILPGYSFRGGRTTIYGGAPVVCATEMPIYSFAMYAAKRRDYGNISAYGIAFLKSEFFRAGGRPAIYGLSSNTVAYTRNEPTCRILDSNVLPVAEQFRYVTYDPSKKEGLLDWSHEREWRWIPRDSDVDVIWTHGDEGIGPTPALPLLKGSLDGGHFSQLCFIVWSEDEAISLNKILTGFFLSGGNNYDTPFDKGLIFRSKIIVLARVIKLVENGRNFDAQTIEGLDAAELLEPITVEDPPMDADQKIGKAFEISLQAAHQALNDFKAKYGVDWDLFGRASIVTFEVTNPLVQRMLLTGKATGPYDGKVILRLDGIGSYGEITLMEAAHLSAAEVLTREIGVSFYMESSLD